MTLVRATTVLGGTIGSDKLEPRWRLALTGMQLAKTPWWSKKPFVLRNVPFTATTPSPKQLAVRVAFGKAASKAKGVKWKGTGKTVPSAAESVRDLLGGGKLKGVIKSLNLPEQQVSKVRHTVATLSQREAELQQKYGVTVPI